MSETTINFNLKPVSLTSAKQLLEVFLTLRRPVFVHGPVGVGKSDLIKQIAQEQNRNVIDIRMSQMDLTDLRGIPFYNPDEKQMEWAPPSMLPKDANDTSIIFLDELNCASPSLQATAYQLILDRRIGEYILPKGVDVIAAGNRDSDKGATFRIAAPLLNRFVHIEVKYDTDTWLKWAEANKVNINVIEYIKSFPDDLTTHDNSLNSKAFATPRTWKFVSDILENTNIAPSMHKDLISACVGYDIAVKALKWMESNCKYNVDSILAGKSKKLKDEDEILSFMSVMVHTLCKRLSVIADEVKKRNTDKDREHFNASIENAFNFILQNSKKHQDTPRAFISLLTKSYNVILNYEQLPSIRAYLNMALDKAVVTPTASATSGLGYYTGIHVDTRSA